MPITELAAAVVGIDDLEVEIDVPDTIAGSGTVTLTYSLEAPDTSSILTASFGIHITTAEGMASMVNVSLRITPYAPHLVARPSKLRTGMVRGQQRTVQFEVTNEGGAASSGVSVLLPSEPWMTLTSPQMLPDLEPGESTIVELSLNPEADLPLATYNGRLILSGPGVNVPVDYEFRAILDAVGDLAVTVEDEYTYFAEGAPKVEGATVKLIDLMTRQVVAQAVTGADGVAALNGIREAEYELRVEADRHNTFRGGIYITPGVLTETRVFLLRELVSYSWSVVPTEIEDEYRIVLEAVFETHVPLPVVTIDSPFMVPVIVEGETTQIEIVATNHGLIAVQGIDLGLPTDHPDFIFTPLVEGIVEIPAKTTITIPVLIELREGVEFSAVDDDGCKTCGGKSAGTAATKDGSQIGGGCDEVQGCLTYYYVCGPDNIWRKECLTLKPLKTAKSAWDCLKALLNEEMWTKGKKNLLDLPLWAVDIVCSCFNLDKCTCAILKMLAGAASGARGGVWGAAAGAIRQLPGLWNCICFTMPDILVPDYTPRPPSGGGGEWDYWGWGWGGGSGTGSGGSPWGGSWGFSAPSGGCTPGDTQPASANQEGVNVTYADEEPDEWEGVCARVRIQIEQRAVMTRSAFLGTLEISNEGEEITLEGISVTLDITDEAGESADHLFGVRQPEVTGMGAVDGTGSLAPMSTGVAKFTLIPNQDAAPEYPTRIFVGGTLRYIDREQEVTVPLFPAPITVYPSANLRLKYYLERDVYSDDPFTDEIEPAVPFSLGLMVSNTGKGAAKNMRITSAQPEIIENEKGLLIEFQIIGAQVGNDPASKSLTVNLGDIEPDMTKVARWLMVASLQGKFIEYSATFEHVDSLGDPRLSLIESVDMYELIHVVRANRPDDDEFYDFLVNTVPGETSMPDELHLSDGTVAPVSVVTEADVDVDIEGETMEVQIAAQMPEGWGYLYIPDPGEEVFKLVSAVDSQGRELLIDWNVWTTHRTFRPLGQPAYRRHRLHLLDCDGTGSYTLTYSLDWTVYDVEPPASEVLPLEPVIRSFQFEVRWSGEDNEDGSGIAAYDIYVSSNGGPFVRWLGNTTSTGALFVGEEDTAYAFYSVVTDRAGNREFTPENAQAETYLPDLTPPVISIQLTPEHDTGIFGDGITSETLPAFIGQTEALSHVFIDVAGTGEYEHLGVTTADDTGEWYYAIPAGAELPEGPIAVSASAIDQAGNESLLPAELTFTVDTTPPAASIDPLPAVLPYVLLLVSWSGEDAISGVMNYDVYAATDDGVFELWRADTADTSAEFLGRAGSTYHFYCIARDNAGNIGEQPAEPQASTLLTSPWELSGDADMNCTVDEADLIFVRNRLRLKVYHDDNYKADVVQDGVMDILDLVHVRNRMGDACE